MLDHHHGAANDLEARSRVEALLQFSRHAAPREARIARHEAEHVSGRIGLSRREFLNSILGVVVCTTCGGALCPDPVYAQAIEYVTSPILLTAGTVLKNKHYQVDPAYEGNGTNLAGGLLDLSGIDIKLENVTLDTGYTTWQSPAWDGPFDPQPPWAGVERLHGIGMHGDCRGAQMRRVNIIGFPQTAIRQFSTVVDAISGAIFQDIDIYHCGQAMTLNTNVPNPISECILLERVKARNGWGLPGSLLQAGATTIGINHLRDIHLRYCEAPQSLGIKLGDCRDAEILHSTMHILNIASSALVDGYTDNFLVQFCTIDKTGQGANDPGYNGIYIQGSNTEPFGGVGRRIYILDNTIRCGPVSDPTTYGGHGILMGEDNQADIRRNIFDGWTGERGGSPAYNLQRAQTAGSNADFATVNTFLNHDPARIEAGPNTPPGPHPWPAPAPASCRPPMMLGV